MCRFAAYVGPEIPLERIVTLPDHSLLEQSQNATEAKMSVNGDGFGLAWYADQMAPGLYRDVLPAWSDGNLPDLCRMVRSGLFLAHVRASTTGATSRQNCHPFRWGRWAFMHNGQIGGYPARRRALEAELSDDLFNARQGTTDSELLFLLMIQNGLEDDVMGAISATLAQISAKKTDTPHRITCALSDGATLFAFRFSSDGRSPTLYIGKDMDSGGCVLASEPLETNGSRWTGVPDRTVVALSRHAMDFNDIIL